MRLRKSLILIAIVLALSFVIVLVKPLQASSQSGASQSCMSKTETQLKALDSRRLDDRAFVLIAKLGCTQDPDKR
jgi:hypothetical protein